MKTGGLNTAQYHILSSGAMVGLSGGAHMDALKTGQLIREIRTERGMSQQALAELLHVSPTAVSKWENGHSLPDISLLEDLSAVLGISISEIVIGERNAEPMKTEAQETAVISVIEESVRQRRKHMLRWLVTTVLACAAMAGLVILLTVVGFPAKQDDILVRTEIQNNETGNPEWVIHFETKDGRSLYAWTEPAGIPSEDEESSVSGRRIHLRRAPLLHANPGSFTWGYSIENGMAPSDSYDFTVIAEYADGEVTYSMREEGLFD